MTAVEERQISIAQWYALAQRGTVLPMRIPLEGDSMRPLIRGSRDLVSIIPLARPLKRGDVVLFEGAPGQYVAHRVRRIRDGYVQTLGDHCWNPDPWMPYTAVIGLAVQAKRGMLTIPLDCRLMRGLGRAWMFGLPLRKHYWRLRALGGQALRRMGWMR
ncbi:MAG: S24/S26 family peptidase [Bacillota bacterium]|nr:S24/S26 family peptidase [Bacillota bacterium]